MTSNNGWHKKDFGIGFPHNKSPCKTNKTLRKENYYAQMHSEICRNKH